MFCVLSVFVGAMPSNAKTDTKAKEISSDAVTKNTDSVPAQLPDKNLLKDNHLDIKNIHDFESLGVFKSWEAFAMITPDEAVCWISSANLEAQKRDKSKKTSSIMLSIRLENQERDEFSYHSLYNLDPDIKLNMTIDNVVGFKLLPQEHWAWLKSSIDESRFVLASQKGTTLVLLGKTTHDKKFKETYSLSGFTVAYKTAFEACSKEINKKSNPAAQHDAQKIVKQ